MNPHDLPASLLAEFTDAFKTDNANAVRSLFEQHSHLKAHINEPLGPFNSPLITCARSRPMLDALLDAGADLNAKSSWWAGGFGLLHSAPPDLAHYAIQRGARIDIHAASRLSLMDHLKKLIAADPDQVHARGPDGQTPLHFAHSIEVAEFLLDHHADIDAHDIDHESTPAQYMLADRPEVARYLIDRGCHTDLLMAAALGDLPLIQKLLAQNPESIRLRVANEYFPMINPKAGGTIYQWVLGWYVSAHDVAKKSHHDQIFHFLLDQSPTDLQLAVACWSGDEAFAQSLIAKYPHLPTQLHPADRQLLVHASRNNNTSAALLMLNAGWPVTELGQHGATALHWAAWHGNALLIEALLRCHPPLEQLDADSQKTPLGWAYHGSENSWFRSSGNYPATIQSLLAAGARPHPL